MVAEQPQLTEDRVIDDLRFLSDRLSSQVRLAATSLLAVAWGLLIAPATAPPISRRGLLIVGGLAVVVLAIDVLQYMFGYQNARSYLARLERGEKIAGYNRRDLAWRVRDRAFMIKAGITVAAAVIFLGVIAPAIIP